MIVVLVLAGIAPASAGGVNFGDDNDSGADDGPSYFGFVRDADGSAVPGARVTASVKSGGAIVTASNGMGVYKFPGFAKEIDPNSVTVSCAKDGYKETNVLRRSPADADSRTRSKPSATCKNDEPPDDPEAFRNRRGRSAGLHRRRRLSRANTDWLDQVGCGRRDGRRAGQRAESTARQSP